MRHRKPDVDPLIIQHIGNAIRDEWAAFLSLLRFHWQLVLLFLAGATTLFYLVQPIPPHHVRMAAGQPGSSLEWLGKQYAENFARYGVKLELVPTAGALENVELLKQGKVDVAFSIGGMVGNPDPVLQSLGSVEYQPLWFFYRGSELAGDVETVFRSKTISVNIQGSGTRSLTEKILALYDIQVENNPHMVSMSSSESVDALLAGKIDGMFLVAGIESQTVRRLAADPRVHLLDFPHADTFAKRLKFLDAITLPRGALNLHRDLPEKDYRLVASTTTILTHGIIHPAIQYLFLNTARKLDRAGSTFFTRDGGFPAHIARDITLSAGAGRYYDKGEPWLIEYVPYWIAVFLEQIWFILFAVVAIGYSLLEALPSYRIIYANLCISNMFGELRELDIHLNEARTSEALQQRLEIFDRIEKRIHRLWVPSGARENFYNLRNAVEILRARTERMKRQLQAVDAVLTATH